MRPIIAGTLRLNTAAAVITGLSAGAVLPVHAAPAQSVTLDQGVFQVIVDGRQVGTETFSIRRTGRGTGAVTTARGRIVLGGAGGGEQIMASLETTGATLSPTSYQVVIEGGDNPRRLAGRVIGRRFSARIISSSGERMREYLVADGAVLVDEGVAHQYYFLARRLEGQSMRIPVIIPSANRQVQATVAFRGTESIQVAGRSVSARHIVVDAAGSVRHVWVDGQGRVLRLEVPSRNYTAVRTGLPD